MLNEKHKTDVMGIVKNSKNKRREGIWIVITGTLAIAFILFRIISVIYQAFN